MDYENEACELFDSIIMKGLSVISAMSASTLSISAIDFEEKKKVVPGDFTSTDLS